MKEKEYIIATNRVKISAALHIMRDVLPGDEYGISEAELSATMIWMSRMEEKLFTLFDCDED